MRRLGFSVLNTADCRDRFCRHVPGSRQQPCACHFGSALTDDGGGFIFRSEQNGTAPRWNLVPRWFHHRPVTGIYPVTESIVLPPDVRDYIMPSLAVLFDPSRVAIQPHCCPRCLGPMVLTHIKPSRIGFEKRTFQGVNCDHVDKIVTETQSMKWRSSRLRAPV